MRRPREFGPYRLLYLLATGGMGEIYRARERRHAGGREVALKRLLPVYNDDENFIVMLTDEARLTSLFDHPNLGRVYEFGVVDDQHFFAMEFIDGVDFRRALRRAWSRNESLSEADVTYVVECALRGLHAAHELEGPDGARLDIVHRDFTPSNIRLGFDGAVKLIDFGIAKARLTRSRTQSGVVKGKVKFMSPEQTERRRLDARSDVFSAGVVAYQALSGRMPFAGDDAAELMRAIREDEHAPLSSVAPGCDAALSDLVDRALSKSAAGRPATAEAMADCLRQRRLETAPDFSVEGFAAELKKMFAAERREDAELYRSYARDGAEHERMATPMGEQSYTRLVGLESTPTEPRS